MKNLYLTTILIQFLILSFIGTFLIQDKTTLFLPTCIILTVSYRIGKDVERYPSVVQLDKRKVFHASGFRTKPNTLSTFFLCQSKNNNHNIY